LINKTFFCVHGGLSPDLSTLAEIKTLSRFQEIPREGPMCDLLWSDPFEEGTGAAPNPDAGAGGPAAKTIEGPDSSAKQTTVWFGYNDTRQCSYIYGIEAVKQFLKDNKLTSIIRAHEAQVEGYKMQMINKASGIPRVITIFSAPNYCDVYKNKAACLKFDNSVLNIKQFIDVVHPYYLPNFMDVFQWSLPFVAEKVTDMLANVLEYDEGSGSDSETEKAEKHNAHHPTILEKKGGKLKQKVMAVSKILRLYKILKEEKDTIASIKAFTQDHKVPLGLLSKGHDAIQEAMEEFMASYTEDRPNERRPTLEQIQVGARYKPIRRVTSPSSRSPTALTPSATVASFTIPEEH